MSIVWNNRENWIKSAQNTKWCLIGCAIGDFGTIAYFQFTEHSLTTFTVMMWAMLNGLITSVILETIILYRSNFSFRDALKTAFGMSFISMLAMESAMNLTDYIFTGGAILTWWVVPLSLLAGFLTPWPYNYWRLQKHGKCCH